MSGNLDTVLSAGRPATELTDEELESQGTQAHATRNWVFLHGTAEQFARHTSRMLELEQEYLRRHPHRTWQGSGGAGTDPHDEAAALRAALRGIVAQLDALAADPPATHPALSTGATPSRWLGGGPRDPRAPGATQDRGAGTTGQWAIQAGGACAGGKPAGWADHKAGGTRAAAEAVPAAGTERVVC